MKKGIFYSIIFITTLVFLWLFCSAAGIDKESLLKVKYLSQPAWSPDGAKIAFIWDEGGREDMWVVEISTGLLKKITPSPGHILKFSWSFDGNILFIQAGKIFLWEANNGKVGLLANDLTEVEDFALNLASRSLACIKNGDIWLFNLENKSMKRLTSTPEIEFEPVFSPDGKMIAFSSIVRPEPISEVPAELTGTKLAFLFTKYPQSEVGVISSSGERRRLIAQSKENELNPRWSPDGQKVVIERRSLDCKQREIIVSDIVNNVEKTIFTEKTKKWIYELSQESYWSPTGEYIAFISDRDGWCHLYIYDLSKNRLIQATRGDFEVSYPSWSPDGQKIAFTSNQDSLIERQIWVKSIETGETRRLTNSRGTNMQPLWAPQGDRIAYLHSDPYTVLDLWVKDLNGKEGKGLTKALPDSIDINELVPPEFFYYRSTDGLKIPAFLFKPKNFDKTKKYPAIIWIHGDGILQNRYGWHPSKNYGVYYGFHQYLLSKGYIVLFIDYRGSIGYGKEFMQGHYMDLGGKDCEDIIKGAEYLQSLDYIDSKRIGVWGLSYGGYLTLQAIIKRPDMFRAAVDVAGVDDWNDWAKDPDGWWIQGRMGNPQENKELYFRSAPINFVDKIKTPLLILHGTADFNVPFYESVRLLDALLKRGKEIEFMMYPGEVHYFIWDYTWRDVFQRVENFFNKYLN